MAAESVVIEGITFQKGVITEYKGLSIPGEATKGYDLEEDSTNRYGTAIIKNLKHIADSLESDNNRISTINNNISSITDDIIQLSLDSVKIDGINNVLTTFGTNANDGVGNHIKTCYTSNNADGGISGIEISTNEDNTLYSGMTVAKGSNKVTITDKDVIINEKRLAETLTYGGYIGRDSVYDDVNSPYVLKCNSRYIIEEENCYGTTIYFPSEANEGDVIEIYQDKSYNGTMLLGIDGNGLKIEGADGVLITDSSTKRYIYVSQLFGWKLM